MSGPPPRAGGPPSGPPPHKLGGGPPSRGPPSRNGGGSPPSAMQQQQQHYEEEEHDDYQDPEQYANGGGGGAAHEAGGLGYEVLADQRPFVKSQLENGLYTVRRLCHYLQKQAQVQAKFADELKKLAEHEGSKKKYQEDQSGTDIVKCLGAMMGGHAAIAQLGKNFGDKLNSQVSDAGMVRHKAFEGQQAKLIKHEGKLEQTKAKQESLLDASRGKAIAEWNKLSAAKKAIDKAYKERNDPKNAAKVGKINAKIAKLIKAMDKQREVTKKSFAATEDMNQKTNQLLDQFHNQQIPELMHDFQQLDFDRLEVLRESMAAVVRLQQEYSQAVLQTLEGMQQVVEAVSTQRQVSGFASSCSIKFKPPVGHEDQFSGLPCSADFLGQDSGTLCDLLNLEAPAAVIRRKNGEEPVPEGAPHHAHYLGDGPAPAMGGPPPARAGPPVAAAGGPPPRASGGGPPPRGGPPGGNSPPPRVAQGGQGWVQPVAAAQEADAAAEEDYGQEEAGAEAAAEGADRWVQAIYEFEPEQQDELALHPGDLVLLLEDDDPEWWKGQRWDDEQPGPIGIFPKDFVQPV